MLNKKQILFLLFAVLLSSGIFSVYIIKKYPCCYSKLKYKISLIFHNGKQTKSAPVFKHRLKNNPYRLHLSAARKNRRKIIKNDEQIRALLRKGALVQVQDGEGVVISRLYYSRSVLTKHANDVLREIGKDFFEASKGNCILVTSLTRTAAAQKRLRKNNRNATRVSTHSYGVSFDISYTRFNETPCRKNKFWKIMDNTLHKFQKEKKIYVVREKLQRCYHVTVRN